MPSTVTDPIDPADPGPAQGSSGPPGRFAGRGGLISLVVTAVGIGVVVAVLSVGGGTDAPAAVAADPTTAIPATVASTTPPTTLRPMPDVGRWDTTIASATGASVEAFTDLPAGVVPDTVSSLVRARQQSEAGWATYSAGPANQSEIPSMDRPVEGRQRTGTGWIFANPSGWNDELTFTVTENHGAWLKVLLPVRPNGTEGWIRASDVTLSSTQFHVHIAVNARTLTVFNGDAQVLSTPVVVGKDATPTPRGRFYVTDGVEKHAGSSYGPWILPLSGFSQALDEFGGGAPVIAIHGTNQPDLAGTAASNGCIRVPGDDTITQMHDQLPQGTPVDITD